MNPAVLADAQINIEVMRRMAATKVIPDIVAFEIVQNIAYIVARSVEPLSEADKAALLVIGATFIEQADREIIAGADATDAIDKAKRS